MRAIGVALGVLSVGTAAAAAQSVSPKAGLGMAFIVASPAGQLAGFLNVFVPISVSRGLRLEPQVGWRTSSFKVVASDPSSSTNDVTGSSRVLLLGVGLLGTQRPGEGATTLYYGPRVGLSWARDNLTDPSGGSLTETQTSWFVNAVVGGEHLFSHLSVGGEVGVGYLHFGTPTWTGSAFVGTDTKGHTLGTSATALVRWYFGG